MDGLVARDASNLQEVNKLELGGIRSRVFNLRAIIRLRSEFFSVELYERVNDNVKVLDILQDMSLNVALVLSVAPMLPSAAFPGRTLKERSAC